TWDARFTFTDLTAFNVLPRRADTTSGVWVVGTAPLASPDLTGWIDSTVDTTTRTFEAVQPELDWSLEHVVGPPGPVLVDAAAHAQLLIVGTRDRTGVARLLSGSVSRYCLHHATCPVVAIPAVQNPNSASDDRGRGRRRGRGSRQFRPECEPRRPGVDEIPYRDGRP
ncbi:MAG: universal stress protein, partial [Propionibacteriaceae bacterium]